MAEELDIDEELEEQKDCSDSTVMNKYVQAGTIANKVLNAVVEKAKETGCVLSLCKFGDEMIHDKTTNLYKKANMARGIAFPTCISKNEIAGHFQPIDPEQGGDAATLQPGDLVKVDLGVHFDGFAALVATTFVMGSDAVEDDKKQKVMAAAYTAAECAIRMMKPGTKNEEITEILSKVAKEYDCECLEGVLSHEIRQFVIDGENTILAKPSPDQQVETFELEPNKVYAIDVVMSSGKGKGIRREEYPTTIYKRVVENQYQLKGKSSRSLLSTINSKFPTYPFSLGDRNFQEKKSRTLAGLKECLSHELVADYPVLHEKEGDFVAQFKFTVIVRPSKLPYKLCGSYAFDPSTLPAHDIQDEAITTILAQKWENPKRNKRKNRNKKKKKQADS